MRERQLRVVMSRGYPVIVKMPKYRRLEMSKRGTIVQEYFEGLITGVFRDEPRARCWVVLRDGWGRQIKVRAGSVLRPKGSRDIPGSYGDHRVAVRQRVAHPKSSQMGLFSEKL